MSTNDPSPLQLQLQPAAPAPSGCDLRDESEPQGDDSWVDLPALHKTKLCTYAMRGQCKYGEKCVFAHDPKELVTGPDLCKTKLCTSVLRRRNCWKRNCSFAHSDQELRLAPRFYKCRMCHFHSNGHCKQGAACRFSHSEEELAAARAAVGEEEERNPLDPPAKPREQDLASQIQDLKVKLSQLLPAVQEASVTEVFREEADERASPGA